MSTETREDFYRTVTAGLGDELDGYFTEVLRTDSLFARAWYRRRAAEPSPLCIDGHAYHRRQKARKRHDR